MSAHHHAIETDIGHDRLPIRSRNPLKRFQRGFEHRFERFRDRVPRVAGPRARGAEGRSSWAFSPVSWCRSSWCRFSGSNFFPAVDSGQIMMHVRGQPGTRIEETARLFDQVEQTVRATIPRDQLANIVDNIGLPICGINMAYQNTGTIGPEDGDALITLKEDHAPTAEYVKKLRTILPQKFPGTTFAFLPADIVVADPQFRIAGADRHPGRRQQPGSQLRLRQRSAEADSPGAGHRRPAHPADLQLPADQYRRRPDAWRPRSA